MVNPDTLPAGYQPGLFESQSGSSAAATATVGTDISAMLVVPAVPDRLWMALSFPWIPLHASGHDTDAPLAVADGAGAHGRVIIANASARDAGVYAGMRCSSALALLPALELRQRDQSAEQHMLESLAELALGFTPVVSVGPGASLLLEVGGSLRLFGGLKRLCRQLRDGMEAHVGAVFLACAPDARAAFWLASAGRECCCRGREHARHELAQLPLTATGWPHNVQQRLHQVGVRTLGDCQRLPRADFARRYGPEYLQQLDQAWGRAPDVRTGYRSPERFSAGLECSDGITGSAAIVHGCSLLLQRLEAFLRERQCSVQRLTLHLSHERHAATVLQLELRDARVPVALYARLLELRLGRVYLPAAVTGLQLEADDLLPGWPSSDQLPGLECISAAILQERLASLLACLRARLGHKRVYGLEAVADHRPERAWRTCTSLSPGLRQEAVPGVLCHRPRPLWLLRHPRPIEDPSALPGCALGVIERIESGWWDGNGVCRDYRVQTLADGRRRWVFHDRRDAGWYLHGLFG